MTPMPLRLFVKKLQPKVGLGRYDMLFAYFVVEAKSKNDIETTQNGLPNPREPPGAYLKSPNQGATRSYQIPFTE